MRYGFPPHDLIGINTDYLAHDAFDMDPDTQVRHFNRILFNLFSPLQFQF